MVSNLKYVDTKIVFQEVPNEITLAINISNCPCKCRGCHSKYLWKDIGMPLDLNTLNNLIVRNSGITCVCFMGGDSNPPIINSLATYVKLKFPSIKIAWYSGRSKIHKGIVLNNFNFIKIGRYLEDKGPLNNPNTNQRFYEINNESLIDKTYLFWKKELN